jgi:hypothetical protein
VTLELEQALERWIELEAITNHKSQNHK